MMIKKTLISVIIFLALLFIIFFSYLILFDTGILFSYQYLKSKTIEDYRNNQTSLFQNINKKNLIFDNNNFSPIKGLINNKKINLELFEKNYNNFSKYDFNNWIRSNGGNYSNKYSNYQQINKLNVKDLELLWKYDGNKNLFFQKKWKNNVEINPIFFDGLVYLSTPFKEVIALDYLTGKLVWKFKSLKKIDARGISFWLNKNDPENSCIFVPIRDSIFCINYKTGKKINTFGISGFVKSGIVRSAPVIWDNNLIVATLDSLKIKAYSLPEGKLNWEIPIHPKDKNFKGGTPWGGISLDSKRGILYVSTGNPRPALYGASRLGNNKNANSIIAFDLINKKIKWSFQEVSHDLWDYDIASPPLLASLRVNNMPLDVVIVMTKIGNTLVFERETGNSIFDIKYKEAPKSNVVDEITSEKQIYTSLPKSTIKFEFNIEDLDKRNLLNRDLILKNLGEYKFGWFEPPSLDKTLILYGMVVLSGLEGFLTLLLRTYIFQLTKFLGKLNYL